LKIYDASASKLTRSAAIRLYLTLLLQVKKHSWHFSVESQAGFGLDSVWYERYFEKLATKTPVIQPQNLPPTAAAARFHSLRVYLQVKQWQGKDAEMLIEEWGWKVIGDQLVPVATYLPPAPDSLLQLI